MHLFIQKLTLLKEILSFKIKFSDLKYLTVKSVSINDILDKYKYTKAVLDIESSGQNGLTMRTFEVLGAGLKLITTNKKILDEDIYDKSNVLLIDRNEVYLNNFFLEKIKIKNEMIEQYDIYHWLNNNLA